MSIARIKVSGFNPNFEDPGNPGMERQLLQEPWFSLHRAGLESILFSELSRIAKVISVEVVCEAKTTIKRMKEKLGKKWKAEEWLRAFNETDVNNDGTLDRGELRELLRLFGCSVQDHVMTDGEFRALWKYLDKDGEGCVDFGELLQAFKLDFEDLDAAAEQSKHREINCIRLRFPYNTHQYRGK